MKTVAPRDALLAGIWRDNPILVQVLGLCPALAVTNTVANGVAMSLAVMFVLAASSFLVSLAKKVIPGEVRISAYIMIIATFVSIADMTLQALAPAVHKSMGAFVPLIVVNCIILGRQEAFASRQPVGSAVADALGNSVGFTLILLVISAVREVLGSGTFLGLSVFGPHYEPWVIMILPPGGFFTLGLVMLAVNAFQRRRARPGAVPDKVREAA